MRVLGSLGGIRTALLLAPMLFTGIFIQLGDRVVGLVLNSPLDVNSATLFGLAGVKLYRLLLLVRRLRS